MVVVESSLAFSPLDDTVPLVETVLLLWAKVSTATEELALTSVVFWVVVVVLKRSFSQAGLVGYVNVRGTSCLVDSSEGEVSPSTPVVNGASAVEITSMLAFALVVSSAGVTVSGAVSEDDWAGEPSGMLVVTIIVSSVEVDELSL